VISFLGFIFNSHDSILFIKCIDTSRIVLSLYVNDMIITSDDIDGISVLKTELAKKLKKKRFGLSSIFHGY